MVERQKRWVEVEKMIKHQKIKKHSLDDKEWKEAFDSENATIWKESVKKMNEKLFSALFHKVRMLNLASSWSFIFVITAFLL